MSNPPSQSSSAQPNLRFSGHTHMVRPEGVPIRFGAEPASPHLPVGIEIPPNSIPAYISVDGRAPLPYDEERGYLEVQPNPFGVSAQAAAAGTPGTSVMAAPAYEEPTAHFSPPPSATHGEFVSAETFAEMMKGLKNECGQYIAMTAYGAVPLPEGVVDKIPERFVAEPVEEERDVFVYKENSVTRTTEKDFLQFEHMFVNVPMRMKVNRLLPQEQVKVVEIPKTHYKGVIQDKAVAIPLGVKYIEVPIEVPVAPPPRVVPIPKPMIIERIIETTKPVIQEKIIEVPEVVKKRVPKKVIREVPYIVPKYVEKIIEVPYRPGGPDMPAPCGAPMTFIPAPPHEVIFSARENIDHPDFPSAGPPSGIPAPSPEATLQPPQAASPRESARGSVLQPQVVSDVVYMPPASGPETQTIYVSPGIREIKLPYEAKIDVELVQHSDLPPGVPVAQPGVRYMEPTIEEAKALMMHTQQSISGTHRLSVSAAPRSSVYPPLSAPPSDVPRGWFLSSCFGCERPPLDEEQFDSMPSFISEPSGIDTEGSGISRADVEGRSTRGASVSTLNGEPPPLYAGPMDPIVAHAAPGMGHIDFRPRPDNVRILTNRGVLELPKFIRRYDAERLLPPLVEIPDVPLNEDGLPDVGILREAQQQYIEKTNELGATAVFSPRREQR